MDRKSIRRIIRFGDTTVGQAMIPLADVIGISETRKIGNAVRLVHKHGYNRLPVYRGNITNVKGVLTLTTWDLMDADTEKKPMSDFIRPPLFLSPQQTIDQTLPLLQAAPDHMGIAVDEFGSAIGILTMEDVFEEVVGDIDVGYDFDEYQPKRQYVIDQESESTYVISGRGADLRGQRYPAHQAAGIGGAYHRRSGQRTAAAHRRGRGPHRRGAFSLHRPGGRPPYRDQGARGADVGKRFLSNHSG